MPFGSTFHAFDHVLLTGDTTHLTFKNNFLSRFGFRVLGMPHIGLRLRARRIKNSLPLHPTRMLDAGFGTGIYSFAFANIVKKIDAIDVDKEKLDFVNQVNPFANITFQRMDLTELAFEDSCFDLIVCSDVLELINDDEAAFSELARVLCKGGTLLLTVPINSDKNRDRYEHSGHKRPGYTKKEIKDLCVKYNLTLTKTEVYSYDVAEKAFSINYKNIHNKLALVASFYPLYMAALIGEFLQLGSPNGIYFKIKK